MEVWLVLLLVLACATPPVSAPPSTPPPAPRFTVDVTGQGPDVLLLPGLASSAHVWDATVVRIGSHHRVHAVQVAGFAGAPAGPNAEGPVLDPLVEELHRYILANHLDHPAIVGHSLGGLVGLLLAIRHPDEVGSLLVVDALPFYGLLAGPQTTVATMAPQAEVVRATLLAGGQEKFAASEPTVMTRLLLSRGPEAAAATEAAMESDHRVVAQAMYEDALTDVRPSLGSIRAPVTVVYAWDASMGVEAPVVDRLWSEAYAGLPGARLARIDGAYHFLMVDQPAHFATVVDGFLGP